MGHQLVGKGVGLGCDTDRDAVFLRKCDGWHQIGHALPHAGPRLYGTMSRSRQPIADLQRHRLLLASALVDVIHPRDESVCIEGPRNLLARRRIQSPHLLGVKALVPGRLTDQLVADCLEREAGCRIAEGEVRQKRPHGPLNLGMHIGQMTQKPRRKVTEPLEEDGPHATKGVHVIHRTVRYGIASKGLGHVGQAMRRESREGKTGKGECVNPQVADLATARHLLHERTVKERVVRHDRRTGHEVRETRHRFLGRRCVGHINRAYARELLNLGGNQSSGVDEGAVAVDDLLTADARRSNLYQRAGEAGRLGVEEHHVLLKRPEVMRMGALGEGEVALLNVLRGTGEHESLKSLLCVCLCHANVLSCLLDARTGGDPMGSSPARTRGT